MIKRNRIPLAIKSLVLIVLCAIVFSFSDKMGADSYEIYLNDKLVLQQVVTRSAVMKDLQLNQSFHNDALNIYYSHCGITGNKRNISIRDGQNKVVKEWHFPDSDAKPTAAVMTCKVADILALQKHHGREKLNLFYSSQQLPDGRLLAPIAVKNDDKVSLDR